MIITGGENVYSREVEEVLYTHPAVAEAAVIGLPDPMWGEKIVAVIQVRAGMTVEPDELDRAVPVAAGVATRSRSTWCSSTSCRATPPARSSSASCATR